MPAAKKLEMLADLTDALESRNKGAEFLMNGSYEEALECLGKSLETEPQNILTHKLIADAYGHTCASNNPHGKANMLNLKGEFYCKFKQYHKALDCLNESFAMISE
ncbi:5556_t:CDS:1, partial [Paraglomus brasilianum]